MTGIFNLTVRVTLYLPYLTMSDIVVTDVEKLKEKHSAKECHLRNLISEVEQLTVQHQNLQQELNAQVVSVGLLSADITRLTDEISVYLLCLFSVFEFDYVTLRGKQLNFSCFEYLACYKLNFELLICLHSVNAVCYIESQMHLHFHLTNKSICTRAVSAPAFVNNMAVPTQRNCLQVGNLHHDFLNILWTNSC